MCKWTNEPIWIEVSQDATDCPPQSCSNVHFGPGSGLMSGINSEFAPSRAVTQWHDANC